MAGHRAVERQADVSAFDSKQSGPAVFGGFERDAEAQPIDIERLRGFQIFRRKDRYRSLHGSRVSPTSPLNLNDASKRS
jgi:hypothetical protein